jgi:hypothetical protein
MYLPIVPFLLSGCESDEESVPRPQTARRVPCPSPDSQRQVVQGRAICTSDYRAAMHPCFVTSRTDANLWPTSRFSAPQKHGFPCLKQPPEYPDGSGGHLWRDPPLESVNCVTAAGQDMTITGPVSLPGQSRPPGRHQERSRLLPPPSHRTSHVAPSAAVVSVPFTPDSRRVSSKKTVSLE